METSQLTLTDFLMARIAEDEENAPESGWTDDEGRCNYCGGAGNARVLAECEAKRRIVEYMGAAAEVEGGGYEIAHSETLRILAAVYADHPDYHDEWA